MTTAAEQDTTQDATQDTEQGKEQIESRIRLLGPMEPGEGEQALDEREEAIYNGTEAVLDGVEVRSLDSAPVMGKSVALGVMELKTSGRLMRAQVTLQSIAREDAAQRGEMPLMLQIHLREVDSLSEALEGRSLAIRPARAGEETSVPGVAVDGDLSGVRTRLYTLPVGSVIEACLLDFDARPPADAPADYATAALLAEREENEKNRQRAALEGMVARMAASAEAAEEKAHDHGAPVFGVGSFTRGH